MSSWVSKATESRNAQLITTAVVSGAVVASTILGFQQARRMWRVADLKASIPDVDDEHHAQRVSEIFIFPFSHVADLVQLTEYGAASTVFAPSKEDERSTALAARARKGDYDDGIHARSVEY
jgi:hypothetical protein